MPLSRPAASPAAADPPDERPDAERLSYDDQAARCEQQFLTGALAAVRLAAPVGGNAGTCMNCGERLPTLALFCDADCQADHERRAAVRARQGVRRGA